ncbi:hypothetical protein GGI12_003156 [Dipsacomyces acuminosporus]|nr:hypothetical protein GGI12_003156 [Dipsacomyces acuminosporus]
MACNLSDPQISEAYTRIVNGDGINWYVSYSRSEEGMVIGYGKTRDTLSLYATGNGGITEMALNVPDEVVFAFLIFEGSNVLVTHVSEKISGVQRARGLAHQKTVASYFEQHDITVNASKPSELTPAMLRDKTRHLAIKTLSIKGAADRSIPKSPNRLRSPIWRTSSQFGSPTTDAAPTSPSARSAKPSTAGSAADAASPVASEPTHSSKEASAVEEDAADPKDNSPRQLHADIEPLNGSFASTADVKKDGKSVEIATACLLLTRTTHT